MKQLLISTMIIILLGLAGCTQEQKAASTEPENTHTGLENGEFTAELNGFKIFYCVYGKGPELMVLPNSWGFTHEGLRALFKPLEKYLTVIYFDPRGMGKSEEIREDSDMSMAAIREDLNALRKHLGLEKVNVIGWSNGGMNLMHFASEYADSVAKAIIVHSIAHWGPEDSAALPETHPEYLQLYSDYTEKMNNKDLTDEERQNLYVDYMMNDSFPQLFTNPDAGREKLKEVWKDAKLDFRYMNYQDIDKDAKDASEDIAKITAPTLVIAGDHDIFSADSAKKSADAIPNSRFVVFENSGHFSPLEEPEKFLNTVLDFLGIDK